MFSWLLFYPSIAFIVTFVLTPPIAKRLYGWGIKGVDLHKEQRPEIPEMGGIAILFGFLSSLFIYYLLNGGRDILISALVVLLVGVLGIVDGLKPLNAAQKVLGLGILGIPCLLIWRPPIFGSIILVPLFFMVACNFTNMLAGFNGMEVGTGAIASIAIAILAFLRGSEEGFVLAACMSGALLAFLYFNRYPASVFPGDCGTLVIGAALYLAILSGRFLFSGAIVFLPYALDAGLKYVSAGVMTREKVAPTEVREGKLYIPAGSNLSLARLFLRRRALTEKEVVKRVWMVEAVFGALAVMLELVI